MRIFNNFPYKIAALCIAFVLWAAAQGFRSEELSLDLPIVLKDTPQDVVVVGQSATEVNLKLKGSRAALRRIEKEPPMYVVSLAGFGPGPARFSVDVGSLPRPRGAEIEARAPSTLVVELDSVVQKRVRVRANLVGQPPAGYSLASVSVVPSQVLLEGSRRSMRSTGEAVTDPIDLSQLLKSTVREVPLVFDRAHVWRAEEDADPIRVEIQIDGPEIGDSAPPGRE